jgi:hypothetical protein
MQGREQTYTGQLTRKNEKVWDKNVSLVNMELRKKNLKCKKCEKKFREGMLTL